MEIATFLVLVGAAFCAGVTDAIAGGGGLITMPALLSSGLPVATALGTNKGQSVFGSAAALVSFWRAGRIERARVAALFVPALAGAATGAAIAAHLDPKVLRPLVIALLVGAALFVALRPPLRVVARTRPPSRRIAAAIALTIGAYDGFFGPGTGTFLIVALVAWQGDGVLAASAHAKVANFASNLAAVALFASQDQIAWGIALPMALFQALGATLGARIAVRNGDALVRKIVLAVVIAAAARLAWQAAGAPT